jgi:hypothetical protein
MATRQTTSKNLKHTPKIRRITTPATPSNQIWRGLEKDLMKLGHLEFAREAEMYRLIAGFLRTNGYRARAKRFAEDARFNALSAKACR